MIVTSFLPALYGPEIAVFCKSAHCKVAPVVGWPGPDALLPRLPQPFSGAAFLIAWWIASPRTAINSTTLNIYI